MSTLPTARLWRAKPDSTMSLAYMVEFLGGVDAEVTISRSVPRPPRRSHAGVESPNSLSEARERVKETVRGSLLFMAARAMHRGEGGGAVQMLELAKTLVDGGADVNARGVVYTSVLRAEDGDGTSSSSYPFGSGGETSSPQSTSLDQAPVNPFVRRSLDGRLSGNGRSMKAEAVEEAYTVLWWASRAVHDGKPGGSELVQLLLSPPPASSSAMERAEPSDAAETAEEGWTTAEEGWTTTAGEGEGQADQQAQGFLRRSLPRWSKCSSENRSAIMRSVNVTGKDEDGKVSTPLSWLVRAARDRRDDAINSLVRLLLTVGAELAPGEEENTELQSVIDAVTHSPLCTAALELRDDIPGATERLCRLLCAGARLKENEVAEYQKYVDALHSQWSVPAHKRDRDFSHEVAVSQSVECPVCMETMEEKIDFVESRLCFHVVCLQCYARTWLMRDQRCGKCDCIRCPQCRKCSGGCAACV